MPSRRRHVGGASLLDLIYMAQNDTQERLERCPTLKPFFSLVCLTASANMEGYCRANTRAVGAEVARTRETGRETRR